MRYQTHSASRVTTFFVIKHCIVFAANLEVNEKIKSELNPVRINEPKTPYRGPMDADEEDGLGKYLLSWMIDHLLVPAFKHRSSTIQRTVWA